MALQILTAASYPALEHHLLKTLDPASARNADPASSPDPNVDPLRPRWVVVPTAVLARHLRLRLAQASAHEALGAVRVTHLLGLMDRLVSHYGLPAGRSCDSELELILTDLVTGLPADHPLARAQGPTAAASGLGRTFKTLADAGFRASESEFLVDAVSSSANPSPAETAVAELYGRFAAAVNRCGLPWLPFVTGELAERIETYGGEMLPRALGCEEGQTPLVCFHGFYEWIDVNARLVVALARALDEVLVFYPHVRQDGEVHPGFEFTHSVLEDLQSRMGAAPFAIRTLARADLPNAAVERFFLETFPEGRIPAAKPDFVGHRKASGLRAEVIAAAVEARRAVDRGVPPQEILVVTPDVDDYRADVCEIFSSFALPFRILGDTEAPSPESAPFEALARLWEGRAEAEWVFHYLRTVPAERIPALDGVNPAAFEAKVRHLGLAGGRSWTQVLAACQRPRRARHGDGPYFDEKEQAFIRKICAFWVEHPENTPDYSLAEAKERFRQIGEQWFSNSLQLCKAADCMDRVNAAVGGRRFPSWVLTGLLESLAEPAFDAEAPADFEPRIGEEDQQQDLAGSTAGMSALPDPAELNRQAVLVAPLMRGRGLTARRIVVMGLDAGRFPRRSDQDPFLSDATRQALAQAARDLGHRLTVPSQVTDEMALLFHLVNSAAPEVMWVIPVADAAGKSVAPCPWVQRYLDSWPPPPRDRRQVPRSPMEQALQLHEEGQPPTYPLLPPDLAALMDPSAVGPLPESGALSEARATLRQRADARPYLNGVQKHVDPLKPLGVTALEALARCPFRFYAEHIAQLEPLQPLEFAGSMDAMTFGSIAHRVLERAVRKTAGKRAASTLAALKDRILAAVEPETRSVEAEFLMELAVLPDLLRRVEMGRLVKWVKTYVAGIGGDRLPDSSPVGFEEAAEVETGVLTVKGKIDRIDRRQEQTVLVDYKTGRPRTRSELTRQVKTGWLLQPSLYPWLYETKNPEVKPASFSIIYLKTAEEVPVEPGDTRKLLDQLAEIVENRAYVPMPGSLWKRWGHPNLEQCGYCALTSLCRRLDPDAVQRYAAVLQTVAPKRARALIDSGVVGGSRNGPDHIRNGS